jgi:hypothetical protein
VGVECIILALLSERVSACPMRVTGASTDANDVTLDSEDEEPPTRLLRFDSGAHVSSAFSNEMTELSRSTDSSRMEFSSEPSDSEMVALESWPRRFRLR